MVEWSNEEIEMMGQADFQGKSNRCPRCSGPVETRRIASAGRATEDVMLWCRRCGARGTYSTAHLEAMKLKWTHAEKIRIVEQYWANSYARCPRDNSRLEIIEANIATSGAQPFLVRCPYCGRNFRSSEVEAAADPETFEGAYDVIRRIKEGGMGSVTMVRQRKTGNIYAAKKILPQYLRDAESLRRFEREKRILQKLDHPHIVPVRDVFMDERGGVIVMDYMPGGDLVDAINGRCSLLELCGFFDGLVSGLRYLHDQGVVHRDLKPANVLIDEGRNARISDFGLARLVERDSTALTQVGHFVGTPLYAAPEQRRDAANVSKLADIYALGLIAYEIATKRSPVDGPVILHKMETGFADALSKALSPTPTDRTVTPEELAIRLRAQIQHI